MKKLISELPKDQQKQLKYSRKGDVNFENFLEYFCIDPKHFIDIKSDSLIIARRRRENHNVNNIYTLSNHILGWINSAWSAEIEFRGIIEA